MVKMLGTRVTFFILHGNASFHIRTPLRISARGNLNSSSFSPTPLASTTATTLRHTQLSGRQQRDEQERMPHPFSGIPLLEIATSSR